MRKEIHWWDFPDDIYILLKEGYRNSLFQESNYRIAKRLNVSISFLFLQFGNGKMQKKESP